MALRQASHSAESSSTKTLPSGMYSPEILARLYWVSLAGQATSPRGLLSYAPFVAVIARQGEDRPLTVVFPLRSHDRMRTRGDLRASQSPSR